MSIIDTTLTNTVLLPSSDSLVSSNPLRDTTIVSDLKKYNTNFKPDDAVLANQFKVFMNSGGKSVQAGLCQSVTNLRINRSVETIRVGGNADYAVRLPGNLSNDGVRFAHFYCNNDAFMDWLINGANRGGVQKSDIEIWIGGNSVPDMIYTLRDAFPVSWNLGTMNVNPQGLILNTDTLTDSIKENQILVENIEMVYGKLEYKAGPAN